jgi:hypothetical protein
VATKAIGASGGTLVSADSLISVTVPAGAVVNNMEFSIQPITNNAPNGLGTGYRLLPEGTHFSQPVTLTFRYTDDLIDGSRQEDLLVASQDAAGVWQMQPGSVLDTTSKTISVKSTHFSDWSLLSEKQLVVDKPSIDFNDWASLWIRKLTIKNTAIDTAYGTLAQWGKTGAGTLDPNNMPSPMVFYQAPSFVPSPNPVIITAKVPDALLGSVTLTRRVYVGKTYFEIVLDGNTNIYPNATAYVTSPYVSIEAHNSVGNGGKFYLPLSGTGTYQFGNMPYAGVDIFLQVGGLLFTDNYFVCDPKSMKQTYGNITISKWASSAGGYIEGAYSGDFVYQAVNSCSYTIKKLSGRFRARRTY